MRTIAIVNQKGGCGKTTVSINLASCLAELGKKTLLVDMDPQGHCAVGLAVPEEQIEQSVYDVLISRSTNEPVKLDEILWQITDKLELAPASIDLSAYEQQMTGIAERESYLKRILDDARKKYDYVVIDCPPAVGLLTFSALRASTDVIVPVETGYFALHGLSKQLETLSILCRQCNQQINVRILASMYDIRTKMAREIMAELRSHFSDKMFTSVVNFNTKLKEAASLGQPINEYDPTSIGKDNFHQLAKEIIGVEASQQKRNMVNTLSKQLNSMTHTADELLKTAKPSPNIKSALNIQSKSKPITPQVKPVASPVVDSRKQDKPQATETKPTLDMKLSDYYGVNQINNAMVFVTLYPRAKSVQIAGDFNNWQPDKTAMQKVGQSGIWQTKMKLPTGKYRYRLVVDGQWQQDPYNSHTEVNPFGDRNSVIEVQ